MALPTAYATEYALATFMSETIGADFAATLTWTLGTDPDAGSYTRAVYAALRMVGVSDVADATDMDALEAAARLAVWQLAMQQTAHLVTVSTDGQTINLSDLHEQAKGQFVRARFDALRVGLNYTMSSTPIKFTDPQQAINTDDIEVA